MKVAKRCKSYRKRYDNFRKVIGSYEKLHVHFYEILCIYLDKYRDKNDLKLREIIIWTELP